MYVDTVGKVSDSSVILFNKIPFLEIEYPIPYKLKDYEKKNVRLTTGDMIQAGLNFYDIITEVRLRNNESEKMNSTEENELTTLLRGGVIYNGG